MRFANLPKTNFKNLYCNLKNIPVIHILQPDLIFKMHKSKIINLHNQLKRSQPTLNITEDLFDWFLDFEYAIRLPKLIDYDERFFKKAFPYKEGVKYENYQLSNIGKYSIFSNCRIVYSLSPSPPY